MPYRDYLLTAKLGTAPSGGWSKGVAVTITGSDVDGTPIVTPAILGTSTHVLGWTVSNGIEGQLAGIRTMFDGTIMVRVHADAVPDVINGGLKLYLTDDGSGRMITSDPTATTYIPMAVTVTSAVDSGNGAYVEAMITTQKPQLIIV